ncbi:NYN domain-containing protein [Mesorhizobium sp. PAMC28654]|uniref:NYN domain-containing protein n=1 Tax=Mesorhizobium sp. PAMC28654 TaxID=2880934 RepID=UPI001D09E0CB|nr:NYN domain-containing protein [Mesorhizobium sp. PAMC28654]UDL87978.1 NYN domain-containing protein [Mesorhizobium sp. PAMC28654]
MKHYLFVDGASLLGRLKNIAAKFFGGAEFEIDFAKLVGSHTKMFFYDAVPVQKDDQNDAEYAALIAPKLAVLEKARSVDRIHVFEGDARKRKKAGHEQKMVDVAIAVDMLTHAFRKNMDETTLLTGDVDFVPLVNALVQHGMMMTLWYPPDETSQKLVDAADIRRCPSSDHLAQIGSQISGVSASSWG